MNKIFTHITHVFLRVEIVTVGLFIFAELIFFSSSLNWQFIIYSLIIGTIVGFTFSLTFLIDYYLKKNIRSHLFSFITRITLSLILYFPYKNFVLKPIEITFNDQNYDYFYNFWMLMPLIFLVFFFFNLNLSALDEPVK